jgi:hypothetical protein
MGTSLETRPKSTDTYGDHWLRTQINGRGPFWYRDPLPGCEVAEATDALFVSQSTVKSASGSDWSNVTIKRVAAIVESDPGRFAGLDAEAIGAEMRRINAEGLKAAALRGTNVHLVAEAMLNGEPQPLTPGQPGHEYIEAVEAFFAQYQPEPILAEYVCFNRTLHGRGYACTADALVRIKGKVYAIDWKSRGDDSRHGCYATEAAQLGAIRSAEYMIVDGERRPIPQIDGGLIVSIKPDGFAVYPVDLAAAAEHWTHAHAWWVARQDERAPIGRMWPKAKTQIASAGTAGVAPSDVHAEVERSAGSDPAPDPALELANSIADWGGELKKLLAAEWPSGVPTPGRVRKGEATWTPEQLVRAQAAINEIVGPFDDPPTKRQPYRHVEVETSPSRIDDGRVLDADVVDSLLATIKGSPVRSIVNGWLREAADASMSWQPRNGHRERHVEITRAAYALASIIHDAPEDADDATFGEVVRAVLSASTDSEQALMPANPIGVVLAHLSIAEARHAAEVAQSVRDNLTLVTFSDQGDVVLTETAATSAA